MALQLSANHNYFIFIFFLFYAIGQLFTSIHVPGVDLLRFSRRDDKLIAIVARAFDDPSLPFSVFTRELCQESQSPFFLFMSLPCPPSFPPSTLYRFAAFDSHEDCFDVLINFIIEFFFLLHASF